jgi:hypothetical protein
VSKRAKAGSLADLESRVEARKRELIAELVEHKMSVRHGAAEARDRIRGRLAELARMMKNDVHSGWAKIGDAARLELADWVTR